MPFHAYFDLPAVEPALASLTAWSYGLAGVGYAAFGLRLAFRRGVSVHRIALLVAIGFTALWGFLGAAFALTGSQHVLIANGIADVLRMGGWFAYLLLLIEPLRKSAQSGPRSVPWLTPVASLLVLTGVGAHLLTLSFGSGFIDTGRVALFEALAAAVFGLMLVEQLFRNAPEDARWPVTPLCVGLAGAFIFDIYLFADALLFGRLDAEVWGVRGFAYIVALPLVALSSTRNQHTTQRIALSRRMVFQSTALLASGAYLMFVAAAGYYVRDYGGSWGRSLQVALVFAGLLLLGLLALSGSIRARLRVLVSKHFFRYRYDYREEWLRFTQKLSGQGSQSELGQHAIKGLADLVESPAAALWTLDPASNAYVQRARWNMAANDGVEAVNGSLARFLATTGWVVNLEEYRSSPQRYVDLELPAWLAGVPGAWLVVPLVIRDELIGFAVLTTARARLDVNWEVNDLLKAAGRQAASFLGQMQANEALLEARKFDAFNRMSAFVVHDLKNIVAQLSLMLRNAERHRANPEFQQDMLMTVDHSIERMKQLMMQLREGTTPVDAPHGVDLGSVIERILRAKSGQEPTPEFRNLANVSTTGHADRLERVIGHLLQNALDATDRLGRVWVALDRHEGQALVEIGDTGHGMTPEFVHERLFKPFQTTKQHGMGIGAYESFQYVKELGGRVAVDSTPGVGTRMRLYLPLFDAANEAPAATAAMSETPYVTSGKEAA